VFLINQPRYLDFASTTPVDSRVLEAMMPYFSEIFGNASSSHVYGKTVKKAVDLARSQVAQLINAEPKEIYFTSGSTESINWALKGYTEANVERGNHIITVSTEHKAVLSVCNYLESRGYEVTYLPVDSNGLLSLEDLQNEIRDSTVLVCVMYVNNEIGVIQNIAEIGDICRQQNVCFFTDATQAVGKLPINVVDENIDMLALSGHKFYGPKGVGALYVKRGLKISPLLHGGGQESELRGGTYNSPSIIGLGKACELAMGEMKSRLQDAISKRQTLVQLFIEKGYGELNFAQIKASPYILSFSLNTDDAQVFLIQVKDDFAASTGSACSSGIIAESHVYKALGLASNIVRVSI
jgi:cysteine desulfurase